MRSPARRLTIALRTEEARALHQVIEGLVRSDDPVLAQHLKRAIPQFADLAAALRGADQLYAAVLADEADRMATEREAAEQDRELAPC